ncbi:MAG: glycosyltransferase family 2 protein [Planctomycetota bacterium]|nr:glycosyltransferase family 2 protein [Planctomycetota bacterium]
MSALRTLVVELVAGESRAAAKARAAGAELRALELGLAGHSTSFTLVARVAAALDEHHPQRVIVPAAKGASGERRAVAAACAAAVAWRTGLAVVLEGAEGELEELDGPLAFARTREALGATGLQAPLAATAVISTWNKCADVCANLDGLRAQVRPFSDIVVVDNASSDATARTIRERYPEVRLVVMPHSAYGACETFNIGFASAVTPLLAILDDDVVLPPDWLEKTVARLEREPETTAIVSSEVEEPGMPAGYLEQEHLRRERYMSTFRGCASLARSAAIRRAGFYDERLFIYGNERDLTCRLLNLGFRVLQYPSARAFHKTPFGIKMGKRSLYYHARNAWLTQLKYAPLGDLARLPWLVLTKVLMRGESSERKGQVSDATGTIGIGKSVRQTPGALGVLVRAAWSVLANVPYCLKHRAPCRAPDFELPLK